MTETTELPSQAALAAGNFTGACGVPFYEPSLSDDASLIAATLAGDTAAFGRLVGLYQDRLYNSLLRVLGSAEDARDVTQDAFVQAFVKLKYIPRLVRILYVVVSHCVQPGHEPHEAIAQDGFAGRRKDKLGREPMDAQPSPDAEYLRREQAEMVHAGLAALSMEYRQILVLREIDGCRYEEIAEILELPIGTVRSRLFRAQLQFATIWHPVFMSRRLSIHDEQFFVTSRTQ